MTIFSISYDLRKPGRNYEELYSALRSFPTRARPLESFWLVQSSMTAAQIRDQLLQKIDAGDGLLVIECGRTAAWHGLDDKTAAWIKEQL